MKFSSACIGALAACASVVSAAPANVQARQNGASTPVTGVLNNGVQIRMELRSMQQQQPDMYNVYLLGLRRMMSLPQNDPLSYYQIAGIHGRPYISWDGSVPSGSPQNSGYCTHVSNIFATWHRPYLALYEQTLYANVQAVANSYPAGDRRTRYQNAAKNFRIPYWDWAAAPCSGCLPYPRLVSNQYVNMDTPDGGSKSMLNPLFRYDFQVTPGSAFVFDPFATWTVTKRFPTSWDAAGVSQNDKVAAQIASNRASFADRVYNLLTNYHNFTQFSNEAWVASSGTPNADSLESVHDAIHSITGNNGHMTYLDYSAFDPIFWLHHTNIDRLWTLWSHLNQGSFVERAPAQGGTFQYAAGTQVDANTPLYPFSSDNRRNYWTSQSVRDPQRFGYLYPEFRVNGGTVASVRAQINALYGSSNAKAKRDLVAHSKRADGNHYHYIANIASQKQAMNGSYAVYMFLGQPSANSADWPTASNLVGTHGIFANLKDKDNVSQLNAKVLVTGTVPLTTTLLGKVSAGELADLSPDTVSPYLAKNLNWRVALFDGTIVAADDAALSVSVVTSDVTPPASDTDFPVWGQFAALPEITKDKVGGHDDQLWQFTTKWSVADLIRAGMKGGKARFLH